MDLAMQAKEQTFLKEKDRLLNFIRNRVANAEEAEDILQDVFFQFVAGYETINSEQKPRLPVRGNVGNFYNVKSFHSFAPHGRSQHQG
jgi:hypothetical protein